MKYSYLHLDRKPDPDREILLAYKITPPTGASLEVTAEKVAAESSVGTWTPTETLSPKIFQDLAAYIYEIDHAEKLVRIAYPLGLFEPGSLPQMVSGIMGNVFSMKELEALRIIEMSLPAEYINSFSGPSLGSRGVRDILGIKSRPIIGSIMKPKIGLNSRENAELAYQVWTGGVDFIKDDENLTDLPVSPFRSRVTETMKMLEIAQKKTGQTKIYAFNVTAPFEQMLERAKIVADAGGRCIMADIVSVGWSGLQGLRKAFPDMIIHGHRAGHSAFTRVEYHGITMMILAMMARLAGVDQLHTGTVVGKMEGEADDVIKINQFLSADWGNLKPVLPVASGGLHPGLVADLLKILGRDLIINFGGGIHGHPDGSHEGAKAARAAVEAASEGEDVLRAAQRCPALARALNHWSNN